MCGTEKNRSSEKGFCVFAILLISSRDPLAYVNNFRLKEIQSTLKQDTKAQSGNRGITQSFFFLASTLDGVAFQLHVPVVLLPGKRLRSHCRAGPV